VLTRFSSSTSRTAGDRGLGALSRPIRLGRVLVVAPLARSRRVMRFGGSM
jgi:hypothetical protein